MATINPESLALLQQIEDTLQALSARASECEAGAAGTGEGERWAAMQNQWLEQARQMERWQNQLAEVQRDAETMVKEAEGELGQVESALLRWLGMARETMDGRTASGQSA